MHWILKEIIKVIVIFSCGIMFLDVWLQMPVSENVIWAISRIEANNNDEALLYQQCIEDLKIKMDAWHKSNQTLMLAKRNLKQAFDDLDKANLQWEQSNTIIREKMKEIEQMNKDRVKKLNLWRYEYSELQKQNRMDFTQHQIGFYFAEGKKEITAVANN